MEFSRLGGETTRDAGVKGKGKEGRYRYYVCYTLYINVYYIGWFKKDQPANLWIYKYTHSHTYAHTRTHIFTENEIATIIMYICDQVVDVREH